ncbi:acyl-CoA dehydrogenase family protein, partial [bacterium]|nr:acyl-CoA dehydrogenase family protein [bacterium]
MEFKFTKDERVIKRAVSNFAQNELVEQKIDIMDHLPMDTIKMMGDLGFLGLMIPEEYGGVPANWVGLGVVTEEIAKGSIAMAYLIMLTCGGGLLLATHGTEEAKEKWLPGLCQGSKMGCVSVTEPDCGSDFVEIKTKAIRDGDFYLLSGEKSPVSFGTQADFVILFAKTDIEAGAMGVTAFLVPLDLPGITKSSITNMGLIPASSAHLMFDDVRIPIEYQIGKEGEGFDINTSLGLCSDFFRILSGLIPMGLAQAALSLAITHAKNRVAFGRPIAQFQAISGKIAEDATLMEMGRWLCYRALWLKDQGSTPNREAAMCSWWCPKSAYQIIEDSLLIHG